MFLRLLTMRIFFCVCAIYESDHLKAELEHGNDEAGSDDVSSERDDGQDTF